MYFKNYFSDPVGNEPYVSDGTVAGTGLLKDIRPGTGYSSSPEDFFVYNNTSHFYAEDHEAGVAIYTTDGTEAGTVRATDLFPHTRASDPDHLTSAGDNIYFVVDDTLWVSDGTQAGSYSLQAEFVTGFGDNSFYYGKTDNHLYFVNNRDLYVTDGTVAGTHFLLTGNGNGFSDFDDHIPAVMDGQLWFLYDDGVNDFELYKSDGTPQGTQMAFESVPGNESIFEVGLSPKSHLVAYQDRLFFSNFDATNGRGLWSSDGTLAGTTLQVDLSPTITDPKNAFLKI